MEGIIFRPVCILVGYLCGCFQTAYLVGKFFKKIDVRQHGSGNSGTTNAFRVMGAKLGLITFLGDVLKTVAAYLICSVLFKGNGTFLSFYGDFNILPGIYAGIGAVIGHNWPVFLQFKGGKGIAATAALFICIDWRIALIAYSIFIIVYLFTHYVSLGSLLMSISLPVMLFMFNYNLESIAIGASFSIFAILRHRTNIVRLITKTESKTYYFGSKKN